MTVDDSPRTNVVATREYPAVAQGDVLFAPPPRPPRTSPVVLRWVCGLAALAGLAFVGLLMLSDRAPGALTSVFGDRARSLWARIDATSVGETIGSPPPADTAVHIVVWAVVVFLAGIAVWSFWGLVAVASAATATGVAIEMAQARWTSTRVQARADVVANLAGIAVGLAAAALVIAVWRLVGWARWRLTRR